MHNFTWILFFFFFLLVHICSQSLYDSLFSLVHSPEVEPGSHIRGAFTEPAHRPSAVHIFNFIARKGFPRNPPA